MNNIVNTLKNRVEGDEDRRAQRLIDDLISLSKELTTLTLSRPKCTCDKMLCSSCRRDKAEGKVAESLKEVLKQFGEVFK